MEKIRWVETPKCSKCRTPWNLKRRYCCMACERIHESAEKPPKKRTQKDRAAIKESAENMRLQGYSLGEIAQKLKIPRATAQRAAAAVRPYYKRKLAG